MNEIINSDKLNGAFSWQSTLVHSSFVKNIFPKDLNDQIDIPNGIICNGSIRMNGKQYSPSILLKIGDGNLSANGQVNLASEAYKIDMDASQFPINSFLPKDSLGCLSMYLKGEGKGFDPLSVKTYTDIALTIDRFDYKKYDYTDLITTLHLKDGILTGVLSSSSEALNLHMDISGNLSPEEYKAYIIGEIKNINTWQMGFTDTPLSVSTQLNISGSGNSKGEYTLDTELHNLQIEADQINGEFKSLALQGELLNDKIQVNFKTPDIYVSFSSPSGLDDF